MNNTGVSIRMYCMGTGDCFLIKFRRPAGGVFTMMIDCGSCHGSRDDFKPYLDDLVSDLTDKTIDLLVITHEHNDHVNGFDKCIDVFEPLTIREAWFAWTENPADPGGAASALKNRQKKMKMALSNAIDLVAENHRAFAENNDRNAYKNPLSDNQTAFMNGLQGLAAINLVEAGAAAGADPEDHSLPGMRKIKDLLKRKRVRTRYLSPGETVTLPDLPGLNFHVMGPPSNQEYIYKDGRQGTDVYNKHLALNESSLAINALLGLDTGNLKRDLPFSASYLMEDDDHPVKLDLSTRVNPLTKADTSGKEKEKSLSVINAYRSADNDWRRIDDDWLNGAGSLALRLNSHINNTSLVLAIESSATQKVLLFPGDAEFGSWESWHMIKDWLEKGKDKTTWAQDLLRRTVFYKVGHHLSYNGTALEKGILMMASSELAAMATLDRRRIAKAWISTMPNGMLLDELIRRTQGKFFIMDEFEIDGAPSLQLDPDTLGPGIYTTAYSSDGETLLYKEYTVSSFWE